jgi:hypothetical protein
MDSYWTDSTIRCWNIHLYLSIDKEFYNEDQHNTQYVMENKLCFIFLHIISVRLGHTRGNM